MIGRDARSKESYAGFGGHMNREIESERTEALVGSDKTRIHQHAYTIKVSDADFNLTQKRRALTRKSIENRNRPGHRVLKKPQLMSSDQHSTHQSPGPDPNPNPSPSLEASNDVGTPKAIDAAPAAGEDEGVSFKVYLSEEIGFQTPTSRGHRIPRSRSCPPAPRKTWVVSLGLKRKLMFEDAAREEVEAFFDGSKRHSSRAGATTKTRTT